MTKQLKPQHSRHTDEYGDTLYLYDQNLKEEYVLEVAGFLPSKDAPHAVTLWRIRGREYTEPHE